MLKLAIRRSRWRWYYLVRWSAELHSPKLSVLLKSRGKKKHLISMKNSCLYDERWNPNDDGIRKNITNMVFDAWWRQSWFRKSRFVSMFFHSLWKLVGKCAKFLRPCNIVKSRLVSRLRFFLSSFDDVTKWRQFLHPCKMSRMPLKPEYSFLLLHWSSFPRWRSIFFCFFSVIRSSSC